MSNTKKCDLHVLYTIKHTFREISAQVLPTLFRFRYNSFSWLLYKHELINDSHYLLVWGG